MWFQMNADQFAGFLDNNPGGRVRDGKNPVIRLDPMPTDIFLETIRNSYSMTKIRGMDSNLPDLSKDSGNN